MVLRKDTLSEISEISGISGISGTVTQAFSNPGATANIHAPVGYDTTALFGSAVPVGNTVKGPSLRSVIDYTGAVKGELSFKPAYKPGSGATYGELTLRSETSGTLDFENTWKLMGNGSLNVPPLAINSNDGWQTAGLRPSLPTDSAGVAAVIVPQQFNLANAFTPFTTGATQRPDGWPARWSVGIFTPATGVSDHPRLSFRMDGDSNTSSFWQFHRSPNIDGISVINGVSTNFSFTPAAASDETLKTDIQDYDGLQSVSNIAAMELKTFVFKNDAKHRVRRGVIAQQIMTIDPEYVHYSDPAGDGGGTYTLDDNVLLLDSIAAIQVLTREVRGQQTEIEALKSDIEELKQIVEGLIAN